MTLDDMKRASANAALEYVPTGATIGVGTGSTAEFFIEELAARPGLIAAAVASSEASAAALRAAGIRVLDPAAAPYPLPLYVDGADEIDPELRLIKGGGGAQTREKVLATAAELFVCIVDALGGRTAARPGFLTDNGNAVLDAMGLDLSDPEGLELELDAIPGVVECGLFARRRADVVLVGTAGGVRRLSGRRTL
jgi:ribose 5-phosphate isomerase A